MNNTQILEKLLKDRRNTRLFKNKPIPKKLISKIIEMGTWAPNHRMTEPWQFVVIRKGSSERSLISKKISKYTKMNSKNTNPESVQKSADRGAGEFEDCPLIIYVCSKKGKNSEETLENYSSTSISIQNMCLYAWTKGIGVGWSTGKPTKVTNLYKILDVSKSSKIVGCLYIGYIENKSDIIKKSRKNHLEKTIWK